MNPSLSQEIPEIKGYQHLRLMSSRGGMSLLYRGTHAGTGQEVIIKLMHAPRDKVEALMFQQRFNQEILIARLSANNHVLAATDHGDIPLHGSGEPRFYLVYPYIEHGSLVDLFSFDRPWETWELPHITDVIAQAAEGLFHLHKSGIVHQDVKPDNFLWMPADAMRNPLRRIHIWLIDFGVAQPERSGKTRIIKGNLRYIAPEQVKGDVKYSVDQYALALLARLLLTGQEPPLPDESPDVFAVRPTQLNPQRLFEPEIDHVLLKALAPQPEARFPNVVEFAQALQQAVLKQIQLSPRAARPGLPQPSPKPQPAKPPIYAALPVQEARPGPPPARLMIPKESIVLPPLNSPRPYEPPRPRGNMQPKSISRPKAVGPALPVLPARKWLTVKLPDTLRMFAWSPSGAELVCTFYHDLPQVISVTRPVETLAGFAHSHAACWSPDGRFLAMSMDDEHHPQAEIRFCDRNTPRDRHRVLSFEQAEPIRGLDWSQRGLLAVWLNHRLLVYDLSNISTRKRLPEPSYTYSLGDDMFCDQLTTLRWSPNGEWLAAGSNNGQIVCWQPHTDMYFRYQPLKKNIRSIGWSPNGRTLVAAFANKQLLFWNLQSDQIAQAALPEHPRMLSISHQTGQIAVATEETLFFFQQIGASAPAARHSGQLYAAFSADNKLATLDQQDRTELVIWQL